MKNLHSLESAFVRYREGMLHIYDDLVFIFLQNLIITVMLEDIIKTIRTKSSLVNGMSAPLKDSSESCHAPCEGPVEMYLFMNQEMDLILSLPVPLFSCLALHVHFYPALGCIKCTEQISREGTTFIWISKHAHVSCTSKKRIYLVLESL